jgi:hypothetical protein
LKRVIQIVRNAEKVHRSIPAQLLSSALVKTLAKAGKQRLVTDAWLILAQTCAKRTHEQFLRK